MLHLLTEEHRQKVVKEYRKRVLTVVATGVTTVVAMSIIFLSPAFFSAYGRYSEASIRKAALDAELSGNNNKSTVESIQEISSSLSALHTFDGKRDPSEIVSNILQDMPEGIQLKNFIFTPSDNSSYIVDIAGRADTRANLVAFRENLSRNTYFDEAAVPLSSFAKERNIDFSVKLKVSGGVYVQSKPASVEQVSSSSSGTASQ